MSTTKRIGMSIAALLVAFSMAEPANAGILDTILNRVNAIRSSVNEMVSSLREGRNQVTSNLKNSINEALETARTTIDEERQGRDDFIARGCDSFKMSTTDMLMASEDAVTAALSLSDLDVGLVSTERARARISDARCRLMYPVYRAVGPRIEAAQADITASANGTAAGLSRLKGLLDDNTKPLGCLSGKPAICRVLVGRKCSTYLRNSDEIFDTLDVADKTVTGLKVFGKVADAAGKIGVWKAAVAVWGWVGGDVEFNLPEFLSKKTEALAAAIEPVAKKEKDQLNACIDLFAQDRTLGNLEMLLSQQ